MRFTLVASFALLVASCSKSSTPDLPPPYGGACDDGCEDLSCIGDARFPGGYCSSVCAETACEEGGTCITDYGTALCFGDCSASSDCRSGYSCWRGTCRPPCGSDAECGGEGTVCAAGVCGGAECIMDGDCGGSSICVSGRCIPDVPVDAGGDAADCGACDGACLPPALGGGCGRACTDRDSCGSFDFSCSPVRSGSRVVGPACVPSNTTGRFLGGTCTPGAGASDCESRFCFGGQCTEACDDDDDCLVGQVCRDVTEGGSTFRACWYSDRTTPIETLDLGTVALGGGAPAPRINLGLPPDAVSVTFRMEQTDGRNLTLSFYSLFSPSETTLYDLAAISELNDQPIRWLPYDSTESAAMLVPNTTPDRVAFETGRYGLVVGAFSEAGESGTARVSAYVKRAPGPVTAGVLTLRIYIAPGLGFDAGSAASNGRLQEALSALNVVYSSIGVRVEVAGYQDVTNSVFSVIESSDGPGSELAALFRESAASEERVLNLFLVRAIETRDSGGGVALGIAGGIPGPPGIHATGHSGVVVAFELVGGDASTAGQVMAHEIGHFLGLFHNTEAAEACAPGMTRDCAPFGGGDVLADTAYGDRRNLMYWSLGRTPNTELSSGQGFVMRHSALMD